MATRKGEEKVPARSEVTHVYDIYVCDICLEDIGRGLKKRNVCDLCGRHMHDNWKCGTEHPEDTSYDYPRGMCRPCIDLWYELYKPMEEKHWAEEEAMQEKIRQESLKWQPSEKQ